MSQGALDEARQALDRALAARPDLDGVALTEAAKALCRHRDDLRRRLRDGGDAEVRTALRTVNQLITLIHAGHFSIGAMPWGLLREARQTLEPREGR